MALDDDANLEVYKCICLYLRIALTNFVRTDHGCIDMYVIDLFLFGLDTRWSWWTMVHPALKNLGELRAKRTKS